jgi:tartrate-resistant acid phosphatase type 5
MSASRCAALVSFLFLAPLATAMPGDACQCGDVTDDREVGASDVTTLRTFLASPSLAPLTPAGVSKCNVAGGPASACDVLDVAVLRRGIEALAPGIADSCTARTGASGNVARFAAFGAQGRGTAAQHTVAATLREACLDRCCDFVQLLGNNVYPSGVQSTSDPQWAEKFEIPYAAVDMPFWAVLGNHDYGNDGAGNDFARGQIQVDYSATVDTKFTLPALYWQRSVAHVQLFGLDSNRTIFNLDAQQQSDVDAWLDASTATWRISAGLHCYRSNGLRGNAGCYDGNCFVPIINGARVKTFYESLLCGRVDLALCAHDHNMQWLADTCAGTELIVAGTGADVLPLVGAQPTHFASESLGFVFVEIDGNTLSAEFINADGMSLFTRMITKP